MQRLNRGQEIGISVGGLIGFMCMLYALQNNPDHKFDLDRDLNDFFKQNLPFILKCVKELTTQTCFLAFGSAMAACVGAGLGGGANWLANNLFPAPKNNDRENKQENNMQLVVYSKKQQ